MTGAKLYAWLKGLATLGGLMAFIGFGYTYWKDTKTREADVILRQASVNQGWLEAELYRLISGSGVNGLGFDELVGRVQAAYFQGNVSAQVDAASAREDAVRRGLLGLAEKNSLVVDTSGKYLVPTLAKNYLTQDLLFSKMEAFNNSAFTLVLDNPGRFSSVELRQKLVDAGATELEALKVVNGLVFLSPPALVPVDDSRYKPNSKLKVLE